MIWSGTSSRQTPLPRARRVRAKAIDYSAFGLAFRAAAGNTAAFNAVLRPRYSAIDAHRSRA